MQGQQSSKKILWVIFLTILIDMVCIGVLIPVFPLLILRSSSFSIIPASWSSSQVFAMSGWLMAIQPLMQFIFTPIIGQFADRYGRRKVLAISICGTALSYIVFVFAIFTKNIPLMFISRGIDGITGGNISVAQTVIGDISEPSKIARNFGLIGMALGCGFILGPFIGGKLSDPTIVSWFNATTPFMFTSIVSFINVFLILIFLPETLVIKEVAKRIDITRPIHNIIKAFSRNQLKNILPAIFLFNAGFTFYTTFCGVLLATKYGFNQSDIGNFFAYLGVMAMLSQGILIRKLSGRVIDYKVLRYSIIGTGICLLIFYSIPARNGSLVYFIPPILAIFVALTKSFSNALINRITHNEIRGEIMGINSSLSALSTFIPSILAGYIAINNVAFPVMVGGFTAILGGILFIYMFKAS